MTWRFAPGEELAGAFRRVAAEEIAAIRAQLHPSHADREAAIHAARRSFKKLRALLRLARPSLDSAFAEQNRRWREAGRLLAHARDATVLRSSFENLVGRSRRKPPEEDVARLRGYLDAVVCSPAGSERTIKRHVAAVLRLLDAAARDLDHLDWPTKPRQLFQGLRKSQARLRASWKKARRDPDPDALHGWRKRLKDLSTQLSLLRDLMPKELKLRLDAADSLAEILGEDRDLHLLGEWLSDREIPTGMEKTLALLLRKVDRRRAKLRQRAFAQDDSLSKEKAKRLAAELATAWEQAAEFPAELPP